MDKRIVFNRPDGGVSICCPTDWAISMMGCGGLWDAKPRGYMDVQIERQIARGIRKDVARRYARAIQFGGCTTAEALEIIRDRDCDGTAIELWDASDVPTDRWFRNAWRRSHNGGPISIDLAKAKPIQFLHIREHVARRRNDLFYIEPDLAPLCTKIMQARDEIELRHIWPTE